MEKVYVVTQGEYSDYSICGIFETSELAAALVQALGAGSSHSWEEARVEEWALNLPGFSPGMNSWAVVMDRAGNTKEVERYRSLPPEESMIDYHGEIHFYMWARDKEHAVKIANEHRTRLIAAGAWAAPP